jgi:putative modified peptide
MSPRNVERVIGRLVTDEQFRRRFESNPAQALQEIAAAGVELTDVELRALAGLDARTVSRFADAIDPRLQKICCRAEETSDESRTH